VNVEKQTVNGNHSVATGRNKVSQKSEVTVEVTRKHSKSRHKQLRIAKRRQSQITAVSLVIIGAVLIFFFVTMLSTNSPAYIQPIKVGQSMSNISLTDLQGKQVKLGDFAGKPVLINAWATWCPPCRAEMPLLQSFYESHQEEGLTFLAINAGESQSTVSNFIRQNSFSFPVLLDPNTDVLSQLGINSFPTSVLVGRDGVIKTIHIGMFTPEALEKEIAAQLNK
jgi:thiol-disulfide isomerase/thioredoxin